MTLIPEMTDPLGKHWDQPKDIREAPIDDTLVLLTPDQFVSLHEYSTSMPSGVYPGKCWKRQEYREYIAGDVTYVPTGRWFLRWYGESEIGPGYCSNHERLIEVVT